MRRRTTKSILLLMTSLSHLETGARRWGRYWSKQIVVTGMAKWDQSFWWPSATVKPCSSYYMWNGCFAFRKISAIMFLWYLCLLTSERLKICCIRCILWALESRAKWTSFIVTKIIYKSFLVSLKLGQAKYYWSPSVRVQDFGQDELCIIIWIVAYNC